MAELPRRGLAWPPILVGHSLGADLIVNYASELRGTAAGLILLDGANPVPEPFVTAADLPELRALWDEFVTQQEAVVDSRRRVLLSVQDIMDLNLEVEAFRSGILGRYNKIDCPISMIMSTSMAGEGDGERTVWRNRNWRAGVERLARQRPDISISWLHGGHGLPFTHAQDRSNRGDPARPAGTVTSPTLPGSGRMIRC